MQYLNIHFNLLELKNKTKNKKNTPTLHSGLPDNDSANSDYLMLYTSKGQYLTILRITKINFFKVDLSCRRRNLILTRNLVLLVKFYLFLKACFYNTV